MDEQDTLDMRATRVVADSLDAYGQAHGVVRLAHDDSHAVVGSQPRGRVAREEFEAAWLSDGATKSSGSGNRAREEAPDKYRTAFECDLDRVKHANCFRRLAGKTQVVIAPRNEHMRNRMTHAIEVAQVAVAIARPLGLNLALTEAMALAHDCGHGPTGHASEEAFGPYIDGGYDHAVWGADVVLAGYNLTTECLNGVRNHSWRRPSPQTAEGEVVSIADRIAYLAHDCDDAVRAGIITPSELPQDVLEVAGLTQSAQIDCFVNSVIDSVAISGLIGITEPAAAALDSFRKFNYERIYLRDASRAQAKKAIVMLRALVDYYIDAPGQIPDIANGVTVWPVAGEPEAAFQAVRYVSSMTDRYAMAVAVDVLDWDKHDLPRGV